MVPPPSSLPDTQCSVLTPPSHTAGSRMAEPRGEGWPAQSQAFPRNSRSFHPEIFSHQLTQSGSHGEAELRNSSLFQNACTCVLVISAEALAHPSYCLFPGHFSSSWSSPPSPFPCLQESSRVLQQPLDGDLCISLGAAGAELPAGAAGGGRRQLEALDLTREPWAWHSRQERQQGTFGIGI